MEIVIIIAIPVLIWFALTRYGPPNRGPSR